MTVDLRLLGAAVLSALLLAACSSGGSPAGRDSRASRASTTSARVSSASAHASTRAARSSSSDSSSAAPSPSAVRPRKPKLARKTCIAEITAGTIVELNGNRGDAELQRDFGSDSDFYQAVLRGPFTVIENDAEQHKSHAAARRDMHSGAALICSVGVDQTVSRPDPVLHRHGVDKLRGLLPSDLTYLLDGIHYYG